MSAGGASQLPFPFLCLLVSGGHNLLVLVKGVGHYMQLGTTLDDALGAGGRGTGELAQVMRHIGCSGPQERLTSGED
jgi:N6-L-threonylcarbamoyladenine synthase